MKKIFKRIIPLFGNFFFATGFFLFLWMVFIDPNDFISQFKLTRKLHTLENEKLYYIKKIEEVKVEKNQIFGSPAQVEKFAREHYLMKKPTEDIYIIKTNE